jgi:probable addiction module antidote protein
MIAKTVMFDRSKFMTIQTTPWDSAKHLKTEEDIQLYLEACLEEEDPALLIHAFGLIARSR